MRRFLAAVISALALTASVRTVASDQDGWSDTCYAQLTMRQVQTRDYSYEILQNCEIVPRAAQGSSARPERPLARKAPVTAAKSRRERSRRRP